MTGEAGANRTFRSIFGEQEKQDDEVLYLELEQSDSSASIADVGTGVAINDDDDEAMWSDELPLSGDAIAPDNNDVPGLQFAQCKSMEEWADDDDEEDNWKDALQDRVNQLELASNRQNRLWNFQCKVAGETTATLLNENRRMRSTSTEFVACNIQTVEHHRKRSGSLGGLVSRMESPRHSLSRQNSLDNSRSSLSRSNSSSFCGTKAVPPADATSSFSSSAAVFNLSDTEAIRRFVLEDVKIMSMERLVSDAQRLHFLENFYQNQQGRRLAPSVTTSTAVSPPSLTSSSSAMSTS